MNQLNILSEDTSSNGFNYQVNPDDSFIFNIRRAMKNTFTGSRADLQKQKIREELVRDYIYNQNKQPAAKPRRRLL